MFHHRTCVPFFDSIFCGQLNCRYRLLILFIFVSCCIYNFYLFFVVRQLLKCISLFLSFFSFYQVTIRFESCPACFHCSLLFNYSIRFFACFVYRLRKAMLFDYVNDCHIALSFLFFFHSLFIVFPLNRRSLSFKIGFSWLTQANLFLHFSTTSSTILILSMHSRSLRSLSIFTLLFFTTYRRFFLFATCLQ